MISRTLIRGAVSVLRRARLSHAGVAVGILIVGAAAIGCASEEADTPDTGNGGGATVAPSTPAPAATRAATPERTPSQPGIGDPVRVGSLELTGVGVEPYDASQHNMFNDSNLRVEVIAVNARGGADSEYNISQLYFQLVDENGIAHDPEFACADCPDAIGSIDLVQGGRVRGYVYFQAPDGRQLTELIYEPLFSTNKARIALR